MGGCSSGEIFLLPPSILGARWFGMSGLPATERLHKRLELLSDREQPHPLDRALQPARPQRRRQHSHPQTLNRHYAKWGNRLARAANPRRPGKPPASIYIMRAIQRLGAGRWLWHC